VLPFQIVRLGSLALVGLPIEVTTMSSRRIREGVLAQLAPSGVTRVVVAGPVNAYSSYVTTREEYALQRYEGASTLFGPWELEAVQQIVGGLATAMQAGVSVDPGPAPRDLRNDVTTFQIGVAFDAAPVGKNFGDVETDAASSYHSGETATVVFWGAHPANDLRILDTFLSVERQVSGSWEVVARDWDWETRFLWQRDDCLPSLACSKVTIEWAIPAGTAAGTYRIRHFGNWKSVTNGQIRAYDGSSREFEVL
jgi:neutral ceramidase